MKNASVQQPPLWNRRLSIVILRACDLLDLSCLQHIQLAVLQAPQSSRHPERSASQICRITKGFMARSRRACPERSRRNPGNASWRMLLRAFRPQTTTVKKVTNSELAERGRHNAQPVHKSTFSTTMPRESYLSGFYETAVECKGNPLCFCIIRRFCFCCCFSDCWDGKDLEEDSSRTSIRTRRESPRTRCLMVSDADELGLLSKARPWKAKPLSAVTQTRDGLVGNKLCSVPCATGEGRSLDGLS